MIRFSVWDRWELLEEYAGGLQRTEAYLQGATGVIKKLVTNRYYHQDKFTAANPSCGGLGSTTHIANAGGALCWRATAAISTARQVTSTQPLNPSTYSIVDLYAGERWIREMRLYDLRNRFMSPELGRFLQADPIGFKGDASNLYRYCGNDPIDRSDPTGLVDTSAGSNLWRNLMNFYVGNPSMNEILAEWTQALRPEHSHRYRDSHGHGAAGASSRPGV